ncbi:MAG: Re/Si-specific NAD(P)(+) transhydrogenase subunit alpha [Candidatus Marinimicrobia bacterium]|nr:Re/Si-specific NAD(P)(+) transhydrogenase subunit alpha [Candidatus Neomarinimicrobiota bacterium]
MTVGVPAELYPGERRVALVPKLVPALVKAGLEVQVEKGAGDQAGFPDQAYEERGVSVTTSREELFATADVILQVHGVGSYPETGQADLKAVRPDQVVIGLFNPLGAPETASRLAETGVRAFALELLPRISRAQSMDVLSSMATIAGYKAVLLAAEALHKIFPMMITAAGTLAPAKVFVVGAGVAGLQAIATSRRLGAAVQAYDVRPAVREQVESLEAKFLEIELAAEDGEGSGGYAKAMDEDFYRRQREMMRQVVAESDVVITTAAIPGKKAPILITKEMIEGMHPGSVILDLAAEGGGNCELTQPGQTVETHGVTILGPVNLPSTIPYHASQMYAKNITTFLNNMVDDGQLHLNLEDEIIRGSLLTYNGEVYNNQVRELLGLAPSPVVNQ